MSDHRPTIVLAHGAFANTSSWCKVIPLLKAKGFSVVAAHCPLSPLTDAVAAVERVIGMQEAPVLLVGYSWGGAIITEAGDNDKVAGLVHIAAAAPDSGESFNALWEGPFAHEPDDGMIATVARRAKPTWFIIGENDRMLLFELEKATAEKVEAKTLGLPSGQLPMLSQPYAVADFIQEAANRLSLAE